MRNYISDESNRTLKKENSDEEAVELNGEIDIVAGKY